jgi:hypothetical protein
VAVQGHTAEAGFTFLSYSHDSEIHKDRVRELAEKLITSGVPAQLDQYQPFPPEGWPSWMIRRIVEAQFVVVVCTEAYYKRAMGLEEPGIGGGAVWESQIITQVLYDAQGQNRKFIPVVLDEAFRRFVPTFLKAYTTPNVSTSDGFVELLRFLTNQPAHIPPPLGKPISLPPIHGAKDLTPETCRIDSSADLVLLHPLDDGFFWVDADEISETAHAVNFVLRLEGDAAVAEARKLSSVKTVGLAYGNTAFMADIKNAKIVHKNQADRLMLEVARSTSDYGVFMEPSLNDMSADKIAEMRVRRILLDESLPPPAAGDYSGKLNAATLEVFIRGMSSPVKILRSPIPMLYYEPDMPKDQREAFLAVARLFAILFLRLSGAIDIVEHLSLEFGMDSTLIVSFAGLRPKKYANAEPSPVKVKGSFNIVEAKNRKVEDD